MSRSQTSINKGRMADAASALSNRPGKSPAFQRPSAQCVYLNAGGRGGWMYRLMTVPDHMLRGNKGVFVSKDKYLGAVLFGVHRFITCGLCGNCLDGYCNPWCTYTLMECCEPSCKSYCSSCITDDDGKPIVVNIATEKEKSVEVNSMEGVKPKAPTEKAAATNSSAQSNI